MWRKVRLLGCGTALVVIGLSPVGTLRSSETEGPGPTGGISAPEPPALRIAQSTAKKKKGAAKKRAPAAESSTKPAPEAAPSSTSSSGKESGPSFARDIAPIIVGNCLGCHDAAKRRGKL